MSKAKNKSITIRSIQASNIYEWNKNYKDKKEDEYLWKKHAVIGESLLSDYLHSIGVTTEKGGISYDLINMKFDYDVKDTITKEELRQLYYADGVSIRLEDLQGKKPKENEKKRGRKKQIKYKMLYRNTGKAKQGQCIFIREEYYNKVLDYMTMGLAKKMKKLQADNAKIVELSAYAPLISATAIDYINIPLENIFVVEDRQSTVLKNAVVVKTKEVAGKMRCYVERSSEGQEISNTLWDGMGLIDEEIFPAGTDGFIYCRSHFFKSCLFRGNVQQYFKDQYGEAYGDAVVTDMFGRKMRIKDIKVIVTENSLKWYKFVDLMGGTKEAAFKYYEDWMKKDGEHFSIIKTGHESKWGELQRSSYQINNSLPTTDVEVLRKIATESIQYINRLKTSDDAFMDHLRRTATKYNINDVLVALDEWTNGSIRYTELFRDKKTRTISRLKTERMMAGKLLQKGDNLTICGNPIALLNEVSVTSNADKYPVTDPCFSTLDEYIQCYTERFTEGEFLAGFRSPHNSPNNIVHMKNVWPEQLRKYFPKLGKHVIVVNGVGTDIQARMNGMDMDSDSMYATNQKQIAELAKTAYTSYHTIINGIEKSSSTYTFDMESYARMDNKIASAQVEIGLSSDLAQLALSHYYDGGCENKVLEDVFIICSVLAQCSIDGAKRTFDVVVGTEIKRLKKLLCSQIGAEKKIPYPKFLAKIKKEEERKKPKKKKDEKNQEEAVQEEKILETVLDCPMDILYDIIDKECLDLRKLTKEERQTRMSINMRSLWNFNMEEVKKNFNRNTKSKVVTVVDEFNKEIEKLKNESSDQYAEEATRLYEFSMKKLERVTISKDMMQTLIGGKFQGMDSPGMYEKMLIVLYNNDKTMFLDCFKQGGVTLPSKIA